MPMLGQTYWCSQKILFMRKSIIVRINGKMWSKKSIGSALPLIEGYSMDQKIVVIKTFQQKHVIKRKLHHFQRYQGEGS